jgi:Na+/H+ antiporter NhaD/arsenite permease-like protein
MFGFAYALVMAEEFTHLRKSKPVILAAGLIWALIAIVYSGHGMNHAAEMAVRHNLLEYAELMLFLLVAMTYINAMSERNVFEALRSWLIEKGYGLRKLFWITGVLAFFISPVADNLTTALLMCAVVMAVGGENAKFVLLACINIVVAANAGGAFSPFGDITTLMVWQKGIQTPQGEVGFGAFFALFIPALVNWLLPAAIMSLTVPNVQPHGGGKAVVMKRGARRIIALFLLTIATAVSYHNFMNLPPVIGMLTGLAYLQFFGYYLKKTVHLEYGMTSRQFRTEIRHDEQFGQPAGLRRIQQDCPRRVGYPALLLRRGAMRRRPRLHRLPGDGFRADVWRLGCDQRQYRDRSPVGDRRQHPGDVCRVDHDAGHVY